MTDETVPMPSGDHPFAFLTEARHPFTETIALQGGGDLTLTQFDGDPVVRVAHEKDGTRLSFGMTPKDVKALEGAACALVLFNETEVLR